MEVELNNDGPVTITLETPLPQENGNSGKAKNSPKTEKLAASLADIEPAGKPNGDEKPE